MVKAFCCESRSIVSTAPWQVWQLMPDVTCLLWLNATRSGRSFTFTHSIGLLSAIAVVIFCISGESGKTFEWQFIQVDAGGTPATFDLSAEE